jgi:hypothetical protein
VEKNVGYWSVNVRHYGEEILGKNFPSVQNRMEKYLKIFSIHSLGAMGIYREILNLLTQAPL